MKKYLLGVAMICSSVSFSQVDYATKVQPIFSNNCSCHLGGATSGVQLDNYTTVITSVGNQFGKKIITPGNSAQSPLYEKIALASPSQGLRMPRGGTPLVQADIDLIKKWIDEGAKDKVTFITTHEAKTSNQFSLEQNYPNPFNPSTMIKYQLPVTSKVSLRLYDLLGREIATLVDELQSAGSHNVQVLTSQYQLSSGVYVYRLQAGNYVETKRMILMK